MPNDKTLRIETDCGTIDLRLRPDAAPLTVRHVTDAVSSGMYDDAGCTFYRSDFVIQCGLHGTTTGRSHPSGKLAVNETRAPGTVFLSNVRGTASLAHFDAPDNGSTEIFINLQDNSHLDDAYGGFCVFAEVALGEGEGLAVVDAIADAVRGGGKPIIRRMSVL